VRERKNIVGGGSNFTQSKMTFLLLGSVKGVALKSNDSNMTQETFCAEISEESKDTEFSKRQTKSKMWRWCSGK
jgi:hypothetical protein